MRHLKTVVVTSAVVLAAIAVTRAQTPRPTFEVLSIKPRTEPAVLAGPQGARPGGVFEMVNVPLVRLILFAYDLRDYQVVEGPGWARTERFDVSARAGSAVPVADIRVMLQSALADRFMLHIRREPRQMTGYALVVARADGRLGSNLKKSDDNCKRMLRRPDNLPPKAVSMVGCSAMTDFARSATTMMGAPVVDRTGLTELYEFLMVYSSAPAGPFSDAGADDSQYPIYMTALQEQLGLKLEASRETVDVLVIESAERPTPD
jgi:uncharacterized protein (TIGR03435 family)